MLPPVWTWDPACNGAPAEEGVVFIVTQAQTEPAGFRRDCAIDGETGQEVCVDNVVYWPPLLIGEEIVEVAALADADVYVPRPGGVTFIDVEAMDEAGNVSAGECP